MQNQLEIAESAATRNRDELPDNYFRAHQLVLKGRHDEAKCSYGQILAASESPSIRAIVYNDLATLAAIAGDLVKARELLQEAFAIEPSCQVALENWRVLAIEASPCTPASGRTAGLEFDSQSNQQLPAERVSVDQPSCRSENPEILARIGAHAPIQVAKQLRVAVLSFLFNWPSSGGGIMHTVGLVRALRKEGHDVSHVFARNRHLGIGLCDNSCPISSTALDFEGGQWQSDVIQRRFRETVDAIAPDVVLITDAWNFKPLLAEAMQGYTYLLRFDAFECLCPLNNIRFLADGGRFRQCHRNQLATPADCRDCVREHGKNSGDLHKIERDLSRIDDPDYHQRLLQAVRQAWAVLAVNPVIATLLEPFADRVLTVPAGIDLERFPSDPSKAATSNVATVLFAGSASDPIKGFNVVRDACARLWQRRRDFKLVVTGEPLGRPEEFASFLGWQTQAEIVRLYRSADMVVIPSVCQEAMPIVAMEAMGASCPVIASRLGGLPFSVVDGTTGLLFEPGDVDDLALQIETLLDHPDRRVQMGIEGRRRFEEFFTWDAVMHRHYRPLLRELAEVELRASIN